jgi:hypothetical protein
LSISGIYIRHMHNVMNRARRNPYARMNFLGLFTFTAPYLPYVLLLLSLLLGQDLRVDLSGILIGHLYFFCEDIYPLMLTSRYRLLKTPNILLTLFHDNQNILPNHNVNHHHYHDNQINHNNNNNNNVNGIHDNIHHANDNGNVRNANAVVENEFDIIDEGQLFQQHNHIHNPTPQTTQA